MPRAEFPTPEEMREMMQDHHEMTFSMIIPPADVTALLALSASFLTEPPCPNGRDCETCNAANTVWWNLCNNLPRRDRIALQTALRESGVALPPAPWEEVPIR